MRISTILLLIVLLAGCSSVREVRTTDQSTIDASRVNRAASGKLARIQMQDGEKIYGIGVRVAPDSTSWVHPQNSEYIVVSTDDVRTISLMRAGQGALVGLGAGIIIGVASGIYRAQSEGDDPAGGVSAVSQSEKMVIYPLAHSAYASLVTTPLGAIIGRKNTYRLVQE